MSDPSSSDDRDPVERLAEEFVARHRRGENPTAEEYANRNPEWATRIHELFPALLMMELHKPDLVSGDAAEEMISSCIPLERLGDYRIIREVGRGGMAVVYEAEQESLGRHVALKVLLRHLPLDPRHAARFQREARAAARLHHTNIVPVYGVGEHEGILYYVMQFIPGQGLDEVLQEVRRLRRQGLEAATPEESREPERLESRTAASATNVARELLSGRFAAVETVPAAPSEELNDQRVNDRVGSAEYVGSKAVQANSDSVPTTSDSVRSSIVYGVHHDSATISGRSRHYWAGVARIGVQVAEALQYSHGQGVLHRDIKPSNLLLDLRGTVWVADFGLAKLADHVDLTNSGDVVGTWRYMAPERFKGESDARSDVYSLGLTLYELLVMHPAFDVSSQAELIRQVGFGVPTRPRKINPEVPRDLETIVLKAIEREPTQRYQSASELAVDLRRFLEGRPPQARRCGPVERLWRWTRRNPAVAALTLCLTLMLVFMAIGSTLAAVLLNAERNRALENLWGAYMAQAHAGRSSHQAGQRFTSLDVLTEAAKIRSSDALRDEAIACLALVDIRPLRRFATMAHEDDGAVVDYAVERYALGDSEGEVGVYRILDGHELARLPKADGPNRHLDFSPNGRYLVAGYQLGRDFFLDLWDIGGDGPPRRTIERATDFFHFTLDGRRMATRLSDTSIGVYDPATGELRKRLTVQPTAALAGFHADGRRLMLNSSEARTLRMIDVESGDELWSHTFETEIGGVCWRGDGRFIAAAGIDHRIYVWDMAADRLQSVLEGHQNSVVILQFTHERGLLISSSWDGSMRVWDPIRGTNLLTVQAGLARIAPDDSHVALRAHSTNLELWELADGRECHTLHHGMVGNRTPRPDNWGPHSLDFSPDGQLLASSSTDGVRLWDAHTGAALAHVSSDEVGTIQFSPDGGHLLGMRAEGPSVWPLKTPSETGDRALRIGPPRFLAASGSLSSTHSAWDETGRLVTAGDARQTYAIVMNFPDLTEIARVGPHRGANQFPISPDGRWVATATWKGKDVNVWEVATGQLVLQIKCDSGFVRFSPDGRWLAVIKFPGQVCELWQVGTWERTHSIHVSTEFLTIAFTKDGRFMAIDDGGRVRLLETETGRSIATLDTGTGSLATFFCLAVSPDGTLVAAGRDHMVFLWDLRRIRKQLALRGLDWVAPSFPPFIAQPALDSIVVIGAEAEGLPEASAREAR